jgi:hypothetical protein
MTNNYCQNCGTKIAAISNFCPKCGHNLRSIAKINEEEVDDERREDGPLIDLSNLKDKIKISVQVDKENPITVGEYLKQSAGASPSEEKINRPKQKLPKGKALLSLIAKECAPSKSKSEEVG